MFTNILNFIKMHDSTKPLPVIRGGTVQLFHGSVWITVLESLFRYGSGVFREKLYCQIKIKKIRLFNLTTIHLTK